MNEVSQKRTTFMAEIVLKVCIFISKKHVLHLYSNICMKFILENLKERDCFEDIHSWEDSIRMGIIVSE
jgi:hypothetical protein